MSARIHHGLTDFKGALAWKTPAVALPWPKRLYRDGAKRFLDVGFLLLALPIAAPIVALLAAVIAMDGRSPFYCQTRVGRGGRKFRFWKLRTMVFDADDRLEDHLLADPDARREWDTFQKLTNDPRITPLGQILRKSSMDEIPQLWNVLVGDMSLVGPRPMLPEQCSLYPGVAYYLLRPGVTGFWQVSERNASTFAQRAEYDADYERRLSLTTDLKVLVATAGVVLSATGR